MKLLYNDSTDPAFNLALEELLTTDASGEYFMLWRNAPSIIVGKHQNTLAEINGEYVRAQAIRVVRRITGGGAVYHDLGNINFSFVSSAGKWTPESSAVYTAAIISALKNMGVDAEFSGRNDITVNGLKISGCARSIFKNRTLFHGTLLFNTDLDILSAALNPDLEKIRSKGVKSIRARVGNLSDILPGKMTMDEFIVKLKEGARQYFNSDAFHLPPARLLHSADVLADKKYRTWDWNYGHALEYDFVKSGRFAGGGIKVSMNIKDNKIEQLSFSGDFFNSRPLDDLTAQLTGLPPQYETIRDLLTQIELSEYLSGITPEELASLLSI